MDVEGPVPWLHGVAGIVGGASSMALFYPLDFLRTRMHIVGSADRLGALIGIVRAEGAGLYRGMSVAVTAHSLGWGTYLTVFRSTQGELRRRGRREGLLTDGAAALVATLTTSFLMTPLNVLRTRAQLACDGPPTSSLRRLVDICREEGPHALLRGFGPQLMLSMNTVVHVSLYEGARRVVWGDTDPTACQVACVSSMSKGVASVLCNPLEVVRTHMQDAHRRRDPAFCSMGPALRSIVAAEGVAGLYRGACVNVCRVVPTTTVAFILYEKLVRLMHPLAVAAY